jgi:hypothetical protein
VNRRLFAGAIALLVVTLGVTACTGGDPEVAAPTAFWSSSSASATATATPSATPSPTAAPSSPAGAPNQPNQPRPTTAPTASVAGPKPSTSAPPPPNPNAAYCQTFEEILGLSFEMLEPLFIIGISPDPAEVEQAWQDLQNIAEQAAARARQAVGQTNDPTLKAVAQTLASQFDYIAAAAAARDTAALESVPEPELPETPEGYDPCRR